MVESVRAFLMVAAIVVPSLIRISGPGTCGALPASAKAATSMAGPLSASGRQVPILTSSSMLSVSPRSCPAGARLSLASIPSMERDGTRDTGFTAATKPRHTTPARLTNAPPIKRGTPGRERSPSWLDRETS